MCEVNLNCLDFMVFVCIRVCVRCGGHLTINNSLQFKDSFRLGSEWPIIIIIITKKKIKVLIQIDQIFFIS
jgi:hypothetical protein